MVADDRRRRALKETTAYETLSSDICIYIEIIFREIGLKATIPAVIFMLLPVSIVLNAAKSRYNIPLKCFRVKSRCGWTDEKRASCHLDVARLRNVASNVLKNQ
jgi:hypothetical protein